MDGREVQGHRAKKKRGRALHAWQPAKSGEGRAGGRLESRGRGGGRWLQWVAAAAATATAAAGTACDGIAPKPTALAGPTAAQFVCLALTKKREVVGQTGGNEMEHRKDSQNRHRSETSHTHSCPAVPYTPS